ncbi:carboxypeptidase-like regulatory domain-containing protein [Saprospiraceae bacterium]|nr:carboxypeptidase-like regulatory domain-containing protein [Saprospiraceae bacterium]
MRSYLYAFFLATIFNVNYCAAQTISGTLTDEDNAPIEYAHVFFKNDQTRGSTSNELGEFNITIYDYNKKDSLVFSALGYNTLIIPCSSLNTYDNIYTMTSSTISLSEIVITSDTYLKGLLKESIRRIPDNYANDKHVLKAYYQNYTISDTNYTEMIQADINIENGNYSKKSTTTNIFLNKLKRTEDNRDLPERLRSTRNDMFYTLNRNNAVYSKSFSYFGGMRSHKTIDSFIESIDNINEMGISNQYYQDGDTILTIKIADPAIKFSINSKLSTFLYTLVSINLSDMAVVKVVFGNIWDEKKDFNEVVYRKINGIYYPSYIRSISQFKYQQETKSHYSCHNILFYDIITDKKILKQHKKGKKLKVEKSLRSIKWKSDENFWSNYIYKNQLPATKILEAEFNID